MPPRWCLVIPWALLAPTAAEANSAYWVSPSWGGWQLHDKNLPLPAKEEEPADEHSRNLNDCPNWEAHWLTYLPTYWDYWSCVTEARTTANLDISGTDLKIKVDCACTHNVKAFVDSYGCCSHNMWAAFCELDCSDPCTSSDAVQCLDSCPVDCIENALYAPEGCDCEPGGYTCFQSLKCITEAAIDHTLGGLVQRDCDDAQYVRSDEVMEYTECLTEQPLRTEWHRHNAVEYCACKVGLGAAAQAANCCANPWAQDMCTKTCLTPSECSADSATACLQNCRANCTHVHPLYVSDQCTEECLTPNQQCESYSTCEPLDPVQYEYVCEDGSNVRENGCCEVATAGNPDYKEEDCPRLCEDREVYRVPQPGSPVGARECMCYECPTSLEEVSQKCSEEWLNDLERRGQMLLLDIKNRVGLPEIALSMQEMMNSRNAEIDALVEANKGICDDALQEDVLRITNRWEEEIDADARRHLSCYEATGELCQDDEEDDDTMMIVGLTVGFLTVAVCGGGVGLYFYNEKIRKRSPQQSGQGVQPRAGDPDVVVGRPVAEQSSSSAAAVGGAPVLQDTDGKDQKDSKGQPPPQFGGAAKA